VSITHLLISPNVKVGHFNLGGLYQLPKVNVCVGTDVPNINMRWTPTEGHSGTLAHADQSYTFLLDTFWLLVDTIKAWDDHEPSNRPNKASKRPIKACF